MRLRLAMAFGGLMYTACHPTLDEESTQALARLGAPRAVTRAQLDSAVGPGPDVTQCSDGQEIRRYDWGGDTTVVVTLRGRRVTKAALETASEHGNER